MKSAGLVLLVITALWASSGRQNAPSSSDKQTVPPVPGAVLGYINSVLPESPKERAARHKEIAKKRQQPVIVLVHRGAWKLAPENTLEAYAAALDNGADGLEIDIHRSKDGVIYMMHDENLDRTTECSGKGGDKTYYEILQCKVKGAPNDSCRVPTFAAVLQLAKERRALLHIDVKDKGLEEDARRMIAEADVADHIVFVNGHENCGLIIKDLPVQFLKHKGCFESSPDNVNMSALDNVLKNEGTLIQTEDPRWTLKGLGRKKKEVPLSPSLRAWWTKDGIVSSR